MKAVLHLAGCVIIGYIAVFYASPVMTALLGLWAGAPVISAVLAFYTARRLKVTVRPEKPVVELGQQLKFILRIENTGAAPTIRCLLRLRCGSMYDGGYQRLQMSASVGPRKVQELSAEMDCDCVGLVECEVIRGWVFDLLHLCRFRISNGTAASAAILPRLYPAAVSAEEMISAGYGAGEDCDPQRGGENTAEVFQIRSYREGDRPQSIHWKLSARADDLIVREFSHTIQGSGALILDLRVPESQKDTRWLNNLFSLALSVAFAMLRSRCRFYLAWYDPGHSCLQRQLIETEEDVFDALAQLYRVDIAAQPEDVLEMYEQLYPEKMRIGVNAKLELLRNEKTAYVFRGDQLEEELREQIIQI